MPARLGLIVLATALAGCATQHKPDYVAVTDFSPDCANRDAQIRYMTKLKMFDSKDQDDYRYNKTIDIQIERLTYYCQ